MSKNIIIIIYKDPPPSPTQDVHKVLLYIGREICVSCDFEFCQLGWEKRLLLLLLFHGMEGGQSMEGMKSTTICTVCMYVPPVH